MSAKFPSLILLLTSVTIASLDSLNNPFYSAFGVSYFFTHQFRRLMHPAIMWLHQIASSAVVHVTWPLEVVILIAAATPTAVWRPSLPGRFRKGVLKITLRTSSTSSTVVSLIKKKRSKTCKLGSGCMRKVSSLSFALHSPTSTKGKVTSSKWES